jgi:Domain of unknown function (DUF4402)
MRNSLRLAVVGAALAAASFATSAQAAATATATATAEILQSLTLTADSALDFGQIAANTGGSVTVHADSTVAQTGSVVWTGTRAPAAFTVTGSKGASVIVTLPAGPSTLYLGGNPAATDTMVLSGFDKNPTAGFQLDALTGKAGFNVGGTLTVGSNQTAGTYSGTFAVSVEYQ